MPKDREPTKAAPGTSFVTSKDGTRIAYERRGAGPPLVVVLGALGYKDFSFAQKWVDEFALNFTVYNYDRRGRGESTDTQPYAVGREIEDLRAVCDAAGGRPFVFGISSGAALALTAAAAGVPMAGLVAYEPPYVRTSADSGPPADYGPHLQRLTAENRRDQAVAYFMRSVGVPRVAVAIMRLFPFWKGLKAVAHTLPYDAAVMGAFEVPTQVLAKVRVPTVIASGSKSPKALQSAAQAAAKAIPSARLRVLPKQNHGVKPKAIGPLLVETFASPALKRSEEAG